MPQIDYPRVIAEDQEELKKLEKRHRYSHLFHRVKMLRLLRSGECSNLGEAAKALGYSRRQCQRWFLTYRQERVWRSYWWAGWASVVPLSWSQKEPSKS
jgi:hypothetical protein